MQTLGIVMAKSQSVRCPDKNIASIAGFPTVNYAICALIASKICDKVIVSTDSDKYSKLVGNLVDYVVMREAGWDDYPYFSVSVNESRKKYERNSGLNFERVAYMGANMIFMRPSWFRVAANILDNYLYNEMPIDLVISDVDTTGLGVCRVHQGGVINPQTFILHHSGIKCDFDFPFELDLAREIMELIQAGCIRYPLDESIHETIMNYGNANHFRGLTRIP